MKTKKTEPYLELKGEMARRDIKIEDVAKIIGTTPATVRQKISGQYDFYITEALAICSAFNLDRSIFFR